LCRPPRPNPVSNALVHEAPTNAAGPPPPPPFFFSSPLFNPNPFFWWTPNRGKTKGPRGRDFLPPWTRVSGLFRFLVLAPPRFPPPRPFFIFFYQAGFFFFPHLHQAQSRPLVFFSRLAPFGQNSPPCFFFFFFFFFQNSDPGALGEVPPLPRWFPPRPPFLFDPPRITVSRNLKLPPPPPKRPPFKNKKTERGKETKQTFFLTVFFFFCGPVFPPGLVSPGPTVRNPPGR